jgi:hypothetical protein
MIALLVIPLAIFYRLDTTPVQPESNRAIEQ